MACMWFAGNFIKDIEINSPAKSSGLKEMDRLVAVNGKEVDSWTHDQVVDLIRQSGQSCRFLVMDKFTDKMYKLVSGGTAVYPECEAKASFITMPFCLSQGNVPPLLFLDALNEPSLPPSYSEALYLPTHAQPSTPEPGSREELKPKLCRMLKSSGSFGFHLNGIEGKDGHFLSEVRVIKTVLPVAVLNWSFWQVVKDRAADVAGMKDGDILVEVNGINVENRSHDEVVEMIHLSGNSLEMLVATKSVYNQLKVNGVNITSQLLGESPEVRVQSTETNRDEGHKDNFRPETPTEAARERVCDFIQVLHIYPKYWCPFQYLLSLFCTGQVGCFLHFLGVRSLTCCLRVSFLPDFIVFIWRQSWWEILTGPPTCSRLSISVTAKQNPVFRTE